MKKVLLTIFGAILLMGMPMAGSAHEVGTNGGMSGNSGMMMQNNKGRMNMGKGMMNGSKNNMMGQGMMRNGNNMMQNMTKGKSKGSNMMRNCPNGNCTNRKGMMQGSGGMMMNQGQGKGMMMQNGQNQNGGMMNQNNQGNMQNKQNMMGNKQKGMMNNGTMMQGQGSMKSGQGMMQGSGGMKMNQGQGNMQGMMRMMQNGNGMMNKDMMQMMRMMQNSKVSIIGKSQLKTFYTVPKEGVVINKKTNTIEFTKDNVVIPIIATPSEDKMFAFGVYGLVNPTIIIKAGATVKLLLVNKDNDMYHAIMITKTPPPYKKMPMMSAKIAFQNACIRPLNKSSNGKYYEGENEFRASIPGTYFYLCQVQDHASKGMYGKLIVK